MNLENHSSQAKTIRVVIDTPAKQGLFDYIVPTELGKKIREGQLIVVPFAGQIHQALVWQTNVSPERNDLKEIRSIVDEEPVITEFQQKLAERISERFLSPLTECVKLMMNEKIRNISTAEFVLIQDEEEIIQQSFFFSPQESDRSIQERQIKALFRENKNRLTESQLDNALERSLWKPLIEKMIRQNKVKKELRFILPGEQPKTVPAAALVLPYDPEKLPVLSRQKATTERRREILEMLDRSAAKTISKSELKKTLGATAEDYKMLEKLHLIQNTSIEVLRRHQHYMKEETAKVLRLNSEQQLAVNCINAALRSGKYEKPMLLYGITGSGKTEVYLRATAEALRLGKQVLMMVPEISLTPQILSRFEERFPGLVGVCHSKLNSGERYDTWRQARSGKLRVIVGPRSAFSMPLPQLGLILVDECHDDSYFQTNELPFFSAVRTAADYAEICGAVLVLGSATPTAAQLFKAEQSKWPILRLTQRAAGAEPPKIELVDMRQELKAGNTEIFSRRLIRETETSLSAGKQVIYYLNRRGSHSYTFCRNCGHTFECPNCDIPLAWHESHHQFECHFCGITQKLPEVCPECGSSEIRQFGIGIELAENMVREKFPDARVIRVDAETSEGVGKKEELFGSFARHEADIMIGTQMIAKGLDFPEVRLVGVLLADVGSNFFDYRVDEHSYQMLTQVAGRAGRAKEQGLALIQTYQPERYSIRAAALGSFDRFYKNEIHYRKLMGYPPFSRLIRLEFRNHNEKIAEQSARKTAALLKERIQAMKLRSVSLIGPAPCFFPRINGSYRWHVILRGQNPLQVIQEVDISGIRVEVDPPSLL